MFNASPSTTLQRHHDVETRPRFGIGHASLPASDVSALAEFYTRIGLRLVTDTSRFAIVELRGGTHLIIRPADGERTVLDLIVDDIDDTRSVFLDAGAHPSIITRGRPHDHFTVLDPDGNTLIVNSNHAIGPV